MANKLKDVRCFLIHGMPRSASTSFRMWLNSTRGCVCHGEILGKNNVRGTSHKQEAEFSLADRNKTPRIFFNRYFLDHRGSAAGFKALSSHLLDAQNKVFLDAFFQRRPFVINLCRENLVERFSSTLFHRLLAGHIKPTDIMSLTQEDVMADCVQTVENWNGAISLWMSGLDFINLDIKNISDGQKHKIEQRLRVWLDEELGKANSKSGKTAREEFTEASDHLENICKNSELDRFRNTSLNAMNLIEIDGTVLSRSVAGTLDKYRSWDDLKAINGIDEAIEKKLNQHRIYYYKQIASWNQDQKRIFGQRIGGNVEDAWVTQAKKLLEKKAANNT